jgi:SAM-dependent methyltransferase
MASSGSDFCTRGSRAEGFSRMSASTPSSETLPPVSREAVAAADSQFRARAYQRHNWRRQEHLASLGLDLFGKSVLELGAGVGDHTTFFLDRHCSVLSVEPRAGNCQLFAESMRAMASAGYRHAARSRLVLGDVESLDRLVTENFDIVYCYGLLYHLVDPERVLTAIAARCADLLLLETCVSLGSHEAVNSLSEPQADPTQSFQGTGCRPTRPWVFNRLKALFSHVYVPRTQPAHDEFPLDWTAPPQAAYTRAVFIGSRREIANPLLLNYLPERQTLL